MRADKEREAGDGFDGTWVAHPDLVPVAQEVFDRACSATARNQKSEQRDDVIADPAELLDLRVPGGTITEARRAHDISVGIQYIEAWLRGNGAVALFNLMEDAATAEIARCQLWQWRTHGVQLEDGGRCRTTCMPRSGTRSSRQFGRWLRMPPGPMPPPSSTSSSSPRIS